MKFETIVNLSGKVYSLLEKINLQEKFDLDYLLDNNCPEFASRLQTYSKLGKIAICATNGKSFTLNFLNQILEKNNNSYFTNVFENSKKYPILTSIMLELNRKKHFDLAYDKVDYYTASLDEYELSSYFNIMKFDYLLLGNLFQDQNDFGNLEVKRKKIQEALVLNSKLDLIINADEPYFFKIDDIKNDAIMNKKRSKFFYGFEEIEYSGITRNIVQKNDLAKCPICACSLDYKKRFYSHLGDYDCACGFKRPKLDLSAKAKIFPNYSFLEVFYEDNKYVFKLPFGGISNAYNVLGAIALAFRLGINRKTITKAIEDFNFLRARDEIVKYKGKNIKVKIIKNPTSLSCALEELYGAKNVKVVFALNDDLKDGEDTSWIWGANFEAVRGFENKVYVCSNRFDDMALRLKYSGINPCLIVMDSSVKRAINCCYYELEENETMLILASPSLEDEVYSSIG